MRILISALVLALMVPAWVCAQNSSEDVLRGKSVDQWVALLGSDKFSDREEASTVLANGGERAVAALKKAAESGDNEVRLRARLALSAAIPVSIEGEFTRISAQSFLRGGRPTPQSNESGESTLTIEKGRLVFWQSYGSGVSQVYSFPEDAPLVFREKCTLELTWQHRQQSQLQPGSRCGKTGMREYRGRLAADAQRGRYRQDFF